MIYDDIGRHHPGLESRVPKVSSILGARIQRAREANEDTLSRAGRYHVNHPERLTSKVRPP